jgi:hypothetical protein
LSNAHVEPAPQERPQRRGVGISDLRRYFVDARVADLQQVHGPLDPQTLEDHRCRTTRTTFQIARRCERRLEVVQGWTDVPLING